MTQAPSRPARGLGRRALLRNGLLTGAGAAVASVALPGLTGVAHASIVSVYAEWWNGYEVYLNAQTQWWWCRDCYALFYSGSGAAAGVCPVNYPYGHNPSGSSMYDTPCNNQKITGIGMGSGEQGLWYWCNWCQGLFYGLGQTNSHCPGNVLTSYPFTTGPHDASDGSYNYNLLYSNDGGPWTGDPPLQSGWLWCENCQGLFWGGSGVTAGLCPINFTSQHQGGGSYKYQMYKN
jgi:hypothetical protein